MRVKYSKLFKDKRILVTGGTGSVGMALVESILKYEPAVIRVFTNDENSLFEMSNRICNQRVRYLLGDVRDKGRIMRATEDIDIVFHAAAVKHVPLCEYNPTEAVSTNVLGTQMVIEAAMEYEVEALITISTDKASSPTNVLGATKLLAEKLTISANRNKGNRKTKFLSVRFGNILGSRGSVLPIFKDRIQNNRSIQITDSNMTRFVMRYIEVIHLLFKCLLISRGSEIFVLKMPVVNIHDLALALKDLSNKSDLSIEKIGRRAGEKLYEELLSENELHNCLESDDMYLILPEDSNSNSSYAGFKLTKLKTAYRSDQFHPLSIEEIKNLLSNECMAK